MTAAEVDAQTESAADAATSSADRPWRRALRAGAVMWLISHAGFAALYTIAFWGTSKAPSARNVLAPLDQWDTRWFLQIATDGYTTRGCGGATCTAAFFPLYPLLVHVADLALPGAGLLAALAVSSLAMLGALAMLYRLVERDFGGALADRTTWYVIAFPTAFFLAVGYNESLFLLLSISCLYLMRGGRWWYAGLLGGLASTTRSVGLLLVVPFCYEYLRQRGRRPRLDAIAVLLIPAGLGAYMLYTWRALHDPLAFSHAQRSWGRHLAWPWSSFVDTARDLARTHPTLVPVGAHLILELAATALLIALIALSFVGPWKMSRDQWALPLYAAALTLVIISFPSSRAGQSFPLYSAPRLALEAFPVFIVLARIGRRSAFDRLYLIVALAIQGAAIVQFLNGGWVS